MKIKTMFAAIGLAVATLGVSGTAEARDRWDDRDDRRWDHDRRWHRDRHWDRGRHWDRRRHWGRHRVHCWTEWHRHQRVRVCR
ncbi:hypothetical protein [Rhizorhabdus dicambivorans]|uniref:Uncharacterized protein n=1 Tax=Rhizorhabdus dicambivorans TaxID=1850238 RepID=A0A2A4FVD7_9SPHN|nr:hypothetical protein [Rhizorhabdus dicambivorans]ATE67550.1 hypothetical protein CMV14_23285 [Rhizorhabdus dicambivorans]PCE42159.1 hypothetical protein COO09_11005 [Rhizorhabdus dicambivorans]